MKTLNDTHEFLKNPNDRNMPIEYINVEEKSNVLLRQILKLDKNREFSILEVGCNVGRNLNFLYNDGFKKLAGIEINKDAVELMKKQFPKMYSSSLISIGSLENKLIKVNEDSYDLVFSMAVLMHIHPDSKKVFTEMARIAKKYIITIEAEVGVPNHPRIWIRNYKDIFERLGFSEANRIRISKKIWGNDYVGRVFEKNA